MKSIFSLLAVLFISASVFAQDNAPVFKFERTTHDFGNLIEGPEATYSFKFTNVGKSPLIIQRCNASCGCTIPKWSTDPIMPGKSGTIDVKYNTKGRIGSFNKTIYIKSNAKSMKERFELYIKGVVIPPKKANKNVKLKPSKQ
jgi:hypothetical protein